MTLLKELLKIATLGTEHSAVDPSTLDGSGSPEHQLLQIVANLKLQALVNSVPLFDEQILPNTCDIDWQPLSRPLTLHYLHMILLGHFKELLPEWLCEVGKTNRCVPPEDIHNLLEAGRKNDRIRESILRVVGERGKWLGEQANSQEWNWFIEHHIVVSWRTSSAETRLKTIRSLRKTNATLARQLVEQVWLAESDALRQQYLKAFVEGLSAEDEPFLLRLQTGTELVRQTAQELLSCLPNTKQVQQTAIYASRFLEIRKTRRKSVVHIANSQEIEPFAILGKWISDKLSIVERAELLVSYVPPKFWRDHFGLSSRAFLDAVARNRKHRTILLRALVQATVRFRATAFADILLDYVLGLSEEERKPLYSMLSQKGLETYISKSLKKRFTKFNSDLPAIRLLQRLEIPWRTDLTLAVIHSIERGIKIRHYEKSIFYDCAFCIPITMREAYMQALSGRFNDQKTLDKIEQMLDFRTEMLMAIHSG